MRFTCKDALIAGIKTGVSGKTGNPYGILTFIDNDGEVWQCFTSHPEILGGLDSRSINDVTVEFRPDNNGNPRISLIGVD